MKNYALLALLTLAALQSQITLPVHYRTDSHGNSIVVSNNSAGSYLSFLEAMNDDKIRDKQTLLEIFDRLNIRDINEEADHYYHRVSIENSDGIIKHGDTLLSIALKLDNLPVTRLLIKQGAILIKDLGRKLLLSQARKNDNPDLLTIFDPSLSVKEAARRINETNKMQSKKTRPPKTITTSTYSPPEEDRASAEDTMPEFDRAPEEEKAFNPFDEDEDFYNPFDEFGAEVPVAPQRVDSYGYVPYQPQEGELPMNSSGPFYRDEFYPEQAPDKISDIHNLVDQERADRISNIHNLVANN